MLTHLLLPSSLIFVLPNLETSTGCCNTPYPNSKIWISVSRPIVNYTFYDIMGQMKKIWAYEVDETATLLKNRKIFEANTASLLCPAGYKTESPYHHEFTTSWPCNVLCLHKSGQIFKPDKWYVICRENSCQSCNLDRMRNSKRSPEFVKLDSAAIANDTFTARLKVLESGMRYNVSLEPGHFLPSILNITIQVDENKAILELADVNQTLSAESPIVLKVTPWLKGDTLRCKIAPSVQYITLYQRYLRPEKSN